MVNYVSEILVMHLETTSAQAKPGQPLVSSGNLQSAVFLVSEDESLGVWLSFQILHILVVCLSRPPEFMFCVHVMAC